MQQKFLIALVEIVHYKLQLTTKQQHVQPRMPHYKITSTVKHQHVRQQMLPYKQTSIQKKDVLMQSF
ncbi:MAG: hypothetical protein EBS68_13120 [Rhodobacteraceae bacterium]|nr:hypothetical protein [Paracoccaceae bacterium]